MKIYERSLQALSFFPRPSYSTLGARDFSSAVSGFCQVFLAASAYQDTRTRVSFCVLVSRDLSRLPQIMESLGAGYMGSS